LCLARDGKIIEAHRLMGDALSHLGKYREAATAYEQSLKLALLGVKRFTVLLTPEGNYSLDEGHWTTHAKLARVWQMLGWSDKALKGYRMALASGHAKLGTYFRMALLQAERREFREAVSVCTRALIATKDRILSSVLR
jgi:tetratricopeptide (TPR) repeat protein